MGFGLGVPSASTNPHSSPVRAYSRTEVVSVLERLRFTSLAELNRGSYRADLARRRMRRSLAHR